MFSLKQVCGKWSNFVFINSKINRIVHIVFIDNLLLLIPFTLSLRLIFSHLQLSSNVFQVLLVHMPQLLLSFIWFFLKKYLQRWMRGDVFLFCFNFKRINVSVLLVFVSLMHLRKMSLNNFFRQPSHFLILSYNLRFRMDSLQNWLKAFDWGKRNLHIGLKFWLYIFAWSRTSYLHSIRRKYSIMWTQMDLISKTYISITSLK